MADVTWAVTARRHLREIRTYIAEQSPRAADLFVEALERTTERLSRFPDSGRRVPEYDDARVREIIFGRYRIIYARSGDRVTIVAVHHAAKNIRRTTPPE